MEEMDEEDEAGEEVDRSKHAVVEQEDDEGIRIDEEAACISRAVRALCRA